MPRHHHHHNSTVRAPTCGREAAQHVVPGLLRGTQRSKVLARQLPALRGACCVRAARRELRAGLTMQATRLGARPQACVQGMDAPPCAVEAPRARQQSCDATQPVRPPHLLLCPGGERRAVGHDHGHEAGLKAVAVQPDLLHERVLAQHALNELHRHVLAWRGGGGAGGGGRCAKGGGEVSEDMRQQRPRP
jgi:hypothetical protein